MKRQIIPLGGLFTFSLTFSRSKYEVNSSSELRRNDFYILIPTDVKPTQQKLNALKGPLSSSLLSLQHNLARLVL